MLSLNKSLSHIFLIFLLFTAEHAHGMQLLNRALKGYRNITANYIKPYIQRRSIFHPVEYKGLDEVFTCADLKEKTSPLFGISLIESDFLKKLYVGKFTDQNSPITQLIKDPKIGMFHCLGNDFRTSQINPAFGLTPEITADIIASLINGTLGQEKTTIIKKIRENYKKLREKSNLSLQSTERFINLLIEAEAEEQKNTPLAERVFPQNFTKSLLLAHLYRSGTKQDLVKFLTQLHQYFPEKIDLKAVEMLPDQKYNNYEISNFDTLIGINNLAQPFYRKTLKDNIPTAQYVATRVANLKYEKSCPLALQGRNSYKSSQSFPDCGETALRNFFNFILQNNNTEEFDLTLLPETIKPTEEFINFYTTHKRYTDVNQPQTAQDWVNVVSGRDNIIYVLQNCEIEILANNFLTFINSVLNINATSFQHLGQLLSTPMRTVSLQSNGNEITISLNSNGEILDSKLIIIPMLHAEFSSTALKSKASNENNNIRAWFACSNLLITGKSLALAPCFYPCSDYKIEGRRNSDGNKGQLPYQYQDLLSAAKSISDLD